KFSEEDLTRFLQIALRTHDELGYKREQRFHLELGILKMVHAQRLLPIEELLSRQPGRAPASGAVGGATQNRAALPTRASSPADRERVSASEAPNPFRTPAGSGTETPRTPDFKAAPKRTMEAAELPSQATSPQVPSHSSSSWTAVAVAE